MDLLQDKILEYLNKINKKIDFMTLKKKLNIAGEEETNLLKESLKTLEENGLLYLDNKGNYQIFNIDNLKKIQGKLFVSKKGNGYVTVEDEKHGTLNYLIYPECLNGALSDDIVVLTDFKNMKSDYILAKVEKVVKRNHKNVVFEYCGNGVFLPYNQKNNLTFNIEPKRYNDFVVGDRVLVEIDENYQGEILNMPVFNGNIISLIGHKDDPKIDIETIAYDYGFSTKFSKKALEELENIPTSVSEEEKEGRVDLTKEMIFTIDGADTKDIDDAISIKKEGENYILGVHIANVSHYVKPGMELFEEAKNRATSAYLVDSVIPMLPHKLSNGICSLNPNVDRLAVTCEMTISPEGKVIDYNIFKSVINSKKQMTYDAVNSILEENIVPEDYDSFTESLYLMGELSGILEEAKQKRGNIDFDSKELKIKTDEFGNPISLEKRQQRTGEKIIENFMLLANETIATNYAYMDVPFVYRIHETPNVDRFTEVMEFLRTQGIYDDKKICRLLQKANNCDLHSYDIAKLLNDLRGKPYYNAISDMILSSMSKARYDKENTGHYGLALQNYTHFTSPIRRFPDLMVHTLIDEYETFERIDEIEKVLPGLCEHASYMERQADEAEKAADELKMVEYMSDYIGEEFQGTVISCNRHGLIIILDNLVKGKASFEDIIDGYYYYGEQSHQLINKDDHSKNYKIGDKVFVKVKDVSIPYRTIDFLASKEPTFEKPKVRRKHKVN